MCKFIKKVSIIVVLSNNPVAGCLRCPISRFHNYGSPHTYIHKLIILKLACNILLYAFDMCRLLYYQLKICMKKGVVLCWQYECLCYFCGIRDVSDPDTSLSMTQPLVAPLISSAVLPEVRWKNAVCVFIVFGKKSCYSKVWEKTGDFGSGQEKMEFRKNSGRMDPGQREIKFSDVQVKNWPTLV